MTKQTRLRALAVGFGLAVCLVAAKPPQISGDGGEYLVYSLNFVALHGPSLRTRDLEGLKQEARDYAPHLEDETFYRNAVPGLGGRRDFMHFWFMSLAAAPFVALAKVVGLPAIYGYAGLNVTMLLGALWVALPRIGIPASILLFASPVVWWLDKAHPEVFTFTLLAVGVLLVRDKPWWAMIAAGTAATQYPHVIIFVGVIAVVAVAFHRPWLTDRRFIAGLGAASLVGLLHPAYYYYRHGTPSLLLQVSNTGAPTPAELSAVLFDPVIGLIANFPMFLVVVATVTVMLVRKGWRGLLAPDVVVSGAIALFFLWVFGVKDNVHHGATPAISRYALWFIPLAIPLLRVDRLSSPAWRRFAWTTAMISAPIYVLAYHPSVPEHGREPTWAAEYLWRQHPAWNNPLPEVFVGTLGRTEDLDVPVKTEGCEKILIGGPGEAGTWPTPCFPPPLPVPCGSRGVWCYANRTAAGYAFLRAPGRWNGVPLVNQDTWPHDAEQTVRRVYEEWEWRTMRQNVPQLSALESARDVRVQSLEGPDRFILVLSEPKPGAALTFKLPASMTGVLVDARTGQTLQTLRFSGPAGQTWGVTIPERPDLMLLAMKR